MVPANFGEDYYLELQRNVDYDLKSDTPSDLMLEQQRVNAVLMQKLMNLA